MNSIQEMTEPEEYFLIGQDDPRLSIYLRYQLFKALEDFAKRETQREQVGLLVGRVSESEGERFLLVEDAIEAPLGDEKSGRFEETMWKRARRIASARHPNRSVVGWFHTHLDPDVAMTEEEKAVHKRHFPEEEHLLYVLSSKGQDRNFFFREEGEMVPAAGFRIYGKKPANTDNEEIVPVSGARAGVNQVPASLEQQNRHLERNIEKLQKKMEKPPVTWKDILIVALLVLNTALILFRPNPPVQVDTSALERGQSELSAQVGSVRNRIEKLEGRLSEFAALDEQLKMAAGLEEIDGVDLTTDSPTMPDESTTAPVQPVNPGLAGGAGVIKLYEVVAGDTLSGLVMKFYPDSPEGTFRAFAEFNRLKGPDFAIFPGDTLKVPALEALRAR